PAERLQPQHPPLRRHLRGRGARRPRGGQGRDRRAREGARDGAGGAGDGVEGVGAVRINWRHCRLGDLGEIRSGGTPATNKNEYWGGHIPWCTPTDITSLKGRFISSTERQITELGVKNSNAELLPPGSVIVCTRATIGEAAINTVPMATNQGFKSIIPTQDVDSDFLYYLVRSLKREFVRRAAGSTFLEISASSFAKIPVRIPDSLEVQRWLVRPLILLDDIAIALQDLIAAKREFKRGLMQELLTGRRRFREFGAPSTVQGRPPEGWSRASLGEIATIRVSNVDKHYRPEHIPVRLCNYMDVWTRPYIRDDQEFMKST